MSGYLSQYNRMVRALRRAEHNGDNKEEKEDDFVTFFVHCWHLKDHIKNDDSLPPDVRRRLEDAIHAEPNLMIARDIANGIKHCSVKPAEMIGHNDVTMFAGLAGGRGGTSIGYTVVYPLVTFNDGTQRRALAVAREAAEVWKCLLSAESLSLG